MSDQERCPCCNGSAIVAGILHGQGGVGFVPHIARSHWGPAGCVLKKHSWACLSCGHLWSRVSPDDLRRCLQGQTGEIGRQFLDEIERGPYRDLPATELAREIGEQVAEIDAMIRNGDAGMAARRYRELRGVIWDQALKDVRDWAELTRPEKLALFGWQPKKKEPFDDLL